MGKIGKSFGDELKTAGLGGLPMCWSADGEIFFSDQVTTKQRQDVLAVLAVHDPTVDPKIQLRNQVLAQIETAATISDMKQAVRLAFQKLFDGGV